MPLAAAASPKVAFIVSVSGPTVSVGQEIFYSNLTGGRQFSPNGTVNGYTVEQLTSQTRNYAGPQGFEPQPTLMNLATPTLWIYGEYDESQPTALCVEILTELANPKFEVLVFPKGNHNLYEVGTGRPIPYINTEGGALDWIEDAIAVSVGVKETSWSELKAQFKE